MIEQFINFVIRPPRAEYNPDQYLWEEEFTIGGKKYRRKDLELQNGRGHTLKCSHYIPSPFPEGTPLPCVIYCHGNSGSRADANEPALILLPLNITVFTLDFSGSGLSDGDYVSLGWHEKDDLRTVVSFLRSTQQISHIGLWGRSMGAVTSLLYGAEDPSIAGIVMDSAFSNLFDLMMELVDVYKIRLPKFTCLFGFHNAVTSKPRACFLAFETSVLMMMKQEPQVKVGVQYMRRVIQRKAKFDIMDLNCMQVAPKTYIPALFGHAADDIFIQQHHSDRIFESYAGDKNIIKFEGDHNSHRPQFYYDSVSIFFYNVLHPQIFSARSNTLEKYCRLGDLKAGTDVDENLLHENKTGACTARTDAASSSSAPPCSSKGTILSAKSVGEVLSEIGELPDVVLQDLLMQNHGDTTNLDGVDEDDLPHMQNKVNWQNVENCSHSSSSQESWGSWSPLGGVNKESTSISVDCKTSGNNRHQISLKVLATPLRSLRNKPKDPQREKKKKKNKKKKKKPPPIPKTLMREKLDKLEVLGRQFGRCLLGKVKQKRHPAS